MRDGTVHNTPLGQKKNQQKTQQQSLGVFVNEWFAPEYHIMSPCDAERPCWAQWQLLPEGFLALALTSPPPAPHLNNARLTLHNQGGDL